MNNLEPPDLYRTGEIRPPHLIDEQLKMYLLDVDRLLKYKNDFVEVNCPVCESPPMSADLLKYKCEFHHCTKCQCLFMSPRPSPALLRNYYAESLSYRYWVNHIYPASEATRLQKIQKPNFEFMLQFLSGTKDLSFLELGGGVGSFAQLVSHSERFSRVAVVEPNLDSRLACLSRGIECYDDMKDLRNKKFNIIAAFEVIEHVFSPSQFLRRVSDHLLDDGLIYLTTPNFESFDIFMNGSNSSTIDTEHLQIFSAASLQRLLQNEGFSAVHIDTPGRLDVDLVTNFLDDNSLSNKIEPTGFLRMLLDKPEPLLREFQMFLQKSGLAGNLRLIARRSK